MNLIMRISNSFSAILNLLILAILSGIPHPKYSQDLDQKINDAFMPIAHLVGKPRLYRNINWPL